MGWEVGMRRSREVWKGALFYGWWTWEAGVRYGGGVAIGR